MFTNSVDGEILIVGKILKSLINLGSGSLVNKTINVLWLSSKLGLSIVLCKSWRKILVGIRDGGLHVRNQGGMTILLFFSDHLIDVLITVLVENINNVVVLCDEIFIEITIAANCIALRINEIGKKGEAGGSFFFGNISGAGFFNNFRGGDFDGSFLLSWSPTSSVWLEIEAGNRC